MTLSRKILSQIGDVRDFRELLLSLCGEGLSDAFLNMIPKQKEVIEGHTVSKRRVCRFYACDNDYVCPKTHFDIKWIK